MLTAKSYFCWGWIIYHVVSSYQSLTLLAYILFSVVICTNYILSCNITSYISDLLYFYVANKLLWDILCFPNYLVLILLKYIMMYKITFWLVSFCMPILFEITLNMCEVNLTHSCISDSWHDSESYFQGTIDKLWGPWKELNSLKGAKYTDFFFSSVYVKDKNNGMQTLAYQNQCWKVPCTTILHKTNTAFSTLKLSVHLF